jgi:hypothetical protein
VHDVCTGRSRKSSDSEFEQLRFGASKLTGAVQVATEKRILFVGMVSEPAWVAGGAGVAAQRMIMENADVGFGPLPRYAALEPAARTMATD